VAKKFDSIVIGTGQSGPSMAARLARSGRKVAVIERAKMGGTCVNYGCIPTKTLVASARAIHMARRGAEFGFDLESPPRVDMKRVKQRKDAVVERSNSGVTKWLEGTDNLELIRGHGRFASAGTIRVGERLLEAGEIFVNVGARAAAPPVPGLSEIPYWTNTEMTDVDFLPESLIILGGSYIGLEFAQMYRRFGSEITVIEAGRSIVSREDADASKTMTEILEGEGIRIETGVEHLRFEEDSNRIRARFRRDGEDREVIGTNLLVGAGRRPNTDDLGLDKAGVETDQRGYIRVDDALRTNVGGVWALGDCNGRGAFTHTSYNDYEIAAANLFDNDPRRVSDRILCYALYTDPPLARIGMNKQQARESGKKVLRAHRSMKRIGRAVESGETQGFMEALIEAETGRILGATILGHNGDEVIHSLLDVMYSGAPYTTISRAVHIHPTISELIPTMLQEMRPLEESE